MYFQGWSSTFPCAVFVNHALAILHAVDSVEGSNINQLRLRFWEEYVGVLRGVACRDDVIELIFEGGTIVVGGLEEERGGLARLVGCRVGVLCTDYGYKIRLMEKGDKRVTVMPKDNRKQRHLCNQRFKR